ncbi:MAG TPA: hypothetical protein VFA09_10335 [Ktedonobacteraceae bacterium]|nr:hypothetical protein [Ktedonobacteraceae bacterium]
MGFTYRREAPLENGEKGYSWLSFTGGATQIKRLLVTILLMLAAAGFFAWYIHNSNDASPDSYAGYGFAILGTTCLVLAAILYTWRRRSAKKGAVGKLNTSLQWHICFGVLGLFLLFLHSFGNFNPRTGTYALYGMIALVISGLIGRVLDRIMPYLITNEVQKALTEQGDDRIEVISQKLQSIVVHNNQSLRSFSPADKPAERDRSANVSPAPTSLVPLSGPISNALPFTSKEQRLHTPWDLAYISLDATPQEINRQSGHYRFVPDKKSELTRPGALMPGAQEQIAELRVVERAMKREQFYRYVIRYWRKFHIALALLTIGLMIWHIVYALQLLLPALIHK